LRYTGSLSSAALLQPPGGPCPLFRFRSATNRSFRCASRSLRRAFDSAAAFCEGGPTGTPGAATCEKTRLTRSSPQAGHGAVQPAGTISSNRAPQERQSNS
jgi:hypothetical protein